MKFIAFFMNNYYLFIYSCVYLFIYLCFVRVFQLNFLCSSFKIKIKSFLTSIWFGSFRSIHRKTTQFPFYVFTKVLPVTFSCIQSSADIFFYHKYTLCLFTKNIFPALKAFYLNFLLLNSNFRIVILTH